MKGAIGITPVDLSAEHGNSMINNSQVGGTHYTSKDVQPWEAMQAWMPEDQFAGYLRGNVIKYLARCDDKGGIEDLKKAQHYLAKLIEFAESIE